MSIGAHRKVVTVLFCDVVGSTALGESVDPEALQGLLVRYFDRMKGIVESYGGSVEKFIGDAVMAVFGVPVVHEDDALRACRAAVEMRQAFVGLGIEGRIGVCTGEVVAGTEERLATGDALNVAARLQQSARPGEVLIADATLALAGDAVDVEQVEPLALKGKTAPVAAFRLLAAHAALERAHDSMFVGRKRELEVLAETWARAVAEQRCELVTVVGDPGIGKSRLAAEALPPTGARVVRGRCLPYGAGITYWPVVEMVKKLGLPLDRAAAAALRALLGEDGAGTSPEEIGWAFRKLLEEQAPLIVVFDDIQWGEETFLDLIEHVALLSTGAPLLLLCMARRELLDGRPAWPVTIRLEPLGGDEADHLIGTDVPDELRTRIAAAAAGNPLFIGEMLAMAQEAGAEIEVPSSLKALLAARLDQLDPAERRVLECGSVEGEVFHRGAVQALTPEEPQVTPRLASLVRRELIRSDRPQFAGEDGFRFRHLLIRDAAYDALPKTTRAELHQRFAAWLEQHGELVELDEIVGYHLEQAARYLVELGRPDTALAESASQRLVAAGWRARWRGDRPATRSLLGRAVALVDEPDVHAEIAHALVHPPRESALLLDDLALRAEARGDATGAALARARAEYSRTWAGEGSVDEEERLAFAAISLLEERGDFIGLAESWYALANGVYNARCEYGEMMGAAERAREYEALAGMPHRSNAPLTISLIHGATPVDEALRRLDEVAHGFELEGEVSRATLLAMSGRVDEARVLGAHAEMLWRERGVHELAESYEIASLAGDHEAAAEGFVRFCDRLEELGELAPLATYAGILGRELCMLGRHDDAERRAEQARDLGSQSDPVTAGLWRQVAALVRAQRGDHSEAERLARQAVEFAHQTDSPAFQGNALFDLGQVLEADGRTEDAVMAYQEALERYEAKRVVPLARRARERLATLQAPTA